MPSKRNRSFRGGVQFVMFEQTSVPMSRNVYADWMLRFTIAVAFVIFGAEKFPNDSSASWVVFFDKVGAGQWFRYCTGVVEILGGFLVLLPWTATVGLALLAATMGSAALILVLLIGRPADSIVSAGFFVGLTAFTWSRRNR